MANLNLSKLVLNDQWPGGTSNNGIPTDGWDNTIDCFKTTASNNVPSHPLGEKRTVYTDNSECPGWYTMAYLQFHDYSAQDISADFSEANIFCSHMDTTKAQGVGASSHGTYCVVGPCYTAAVSDLTKGGPLAIPCWTADADSSVALVTGAASDLSYGDAFGWFWVGGVCPCKDATLLQGLAGSLEGADVTAGNGRGPVLFHIDTGVGVPYINEVTLLEATTLVGVLHRAPAAWACVSAA